jgi:hypothetical protein|tara:strand:- start:2348 stop:2815 length:468 start_codon:yes stop_codon:yes gene_type:complete
MIDTLDKLLQLFPNKADLNRICKLSSGASSHWFKPNRKHAPDVQSVIRMADYIRITNEELGAVIRDLGEIRIELQNKRKRSREAKKREKLKRMEERKEMERRKRVARSSQFLERMEREKELAEKQIKEKEAYLELQKRLQRLEQLEKKLQNNKNT